MWLSDAMWPSPVAVGTWPGAFDCGGRRVQSHCLRRINRLGLKLLKSSEWVYDRSGWKIVDVLQWQGKMRTLYTYLIYTYIYLCMFDWQIGGFNYNCGFVQVDSCSISMCVGCLNHQKPSHVAIATGHPQQCAWACRFMKRSAGCHNKASGWMGLSSTVDRSWPSNSDVFFDLLFFGFMNIENGLYYVQTAYKIIIELHNSPHAHSFVRPCVCVCDSEMPSYSVWVFLLGVFYAGCLNPIARYCRF